MTSLGAKPAPPDGGWGWMIVFCSFMIHFIGISTPLSLGIMYVSWLEEFHSGRSFTSWVISLEFAIFFTTGPIASVMVSRFGYRSTVFVGAAIAFVGYSLSFFATDVVMLVVFIGIISGFGCGFCYLPAIAAVAVYFEKRRSLALGIATSGTGIGCLLLAPLYHWLILTYSWRGSLLIIGAMHLNMCALGLLMRPLIERPKMKHTVVCSSNTELSKSLLNSRKEKHAAQQTLTLNGDNYSPVISSIKSNNYLLNTKYLNTEDNETHAPLTHGGIIGSTTTHDKPDHNDVHQLVTHSNTLSKQPSGSVGHLALYKNEWPLRPFLSVSELCYQNGVLCEGLKKNHFASDILMSGSIHSLSMIDVRSIKHNASSLSIPADHKDDSLIKSICKRFLYPLFENFLLLRKPAFCIFIISNTLTNLSYLMPVLYMVDRAIESGIDTATAAMFLSVYGVGNVMGRLLMGVLGDRQGVNRTMLYIIVLFVCGLATCLSPLSGRVMLLHGTYAFFFGVTIGAFTTLVPIVTVDIVGVSLVGQAYGVVLVFSGVSGALGPPLAGLIFDWTGNFTASYVLHGVFVLVSSLVLLPVVFMKDRTTKL